MRRFSNQSAGNQIDMTSSDDDTFPSLPTAYGQIRAHVPEMKRWLEQIGPMLKKELLKKDQDQYPLVISSGRHFDYNADNLMRDPEWNKGKN